MARLLIALLIALLPMPGATAQACHAPAPVAQAGHHGHAPRQEAPAPHHIAPDLCMGCVAPATVLPPVVSAPPAFAPTLLQPGRDAGLAQSGAEPATPPPRLRS